MKMSIQGLLLVSALLLTSLSLAEVKIAYVDLQQALQATSAGKKAKKELEAEFTRKKKELDAQESDLKKKREDITKKKDLLSPAALQQKAAEFQQEMLKYREKFSKSQADIQKRERELTSPILKKLGGIIEELAKDKGLDMILEKSQQGIVWAKKEMDITAQLVAKFEKKKKK